MRPTAAAAALLGLLIAAPAVAEEPAPGSPFRALIPTSAERAHARASALQLAIERMLVALPGVEGARAVVELADAASLPLDRPLPPSAVTLLLVLTPGAKPPERTQLVRLVTGSARELAGARVLVELTQGAAAAASSETLVSIGPFRVSARSAPRVRAVLAASLLANVMLATVLLWRMRRRSRTRALY